MPSAMPSSSGLSRARPCGRSATGWVRTSSWAETNVLGPATLTFKLRLRTAYGSFTALVDGEAVCANGDSETLNYGTSWVSASASIPSGQHTVRLADTHQGYGFTSGGNGAWVGQLTFNGGSPAREETTTTEVSVLRMVGWPATIRAIRLPITRRARPRGARTATPSGSRMWPGSIRPTSPACSRPSFPSWTASRS